MLGSNLKKIGCIILSMIFISDICNFNHLKSYARSSDVSITEGIEISRRRQRELTQKKDSLRKDLHTVKGTIESREKRKKELSEQIESVKKDIDVSNEVINDLDVKIKDQKQLIDEKQNQISTDVSIIMKRLRASYMGNKVEAIDIVLGTKDFLDFFDRMEIAQCMSEKDNKIISKLKEDKDTIERQKKDIEDSQSRMRKEVLTRENKKAELEKLIDENELLIKESKDQAVKIQDEIDQSDKEYNKINREIEEYYRRQRELEEKRRRQNQNRVRGQNPNRVHNNVAKGTGRYMWPVPNFHYISSNFTDTVNRGGRMHGAIDIAGRGIYGASVVAADSGVIIKVNDTPWGGGYGNFIVIDHGNGRSTLYGHLSLKRVTVGQTVAKGQQIGNVGNTGFSTGPHLHFETRMNGKKYDPLTEVR